MPSNVLKHIHHNILTDFLTAYYSGEKKLDCSSEMEIS